jgi:deoxycytidine triphosphate deaminase
MNMPKRLQGDTVEGDQQDLTTRRQKERDRLIALHGKCPATDKDFPYTGVLLSDGIKYCVDTFDLVRPFDEGNLKPANYKLTIGNQYAMDGKIYELTDSTNEGALTIPPFQVAVIKTRETINMPKFLIARWNIRVQLAYKGLLWVGGPQVDAGYVGHLFCPVYNLSDKPVSLKYGDAIAVMDFVRTSAFHEGESLLYRDVPPERILFEDYAPQELNSALYEIADKRLGKVEDRTTTTERNVAEGLKDSREKTDASIKEIQTRVDTFVLITFTVIAVLFAAVTIFATGSENKPTWNFVLFLTSLTSILAMLFSATVWLQMRKVTNAFGSTLQIVVLLIVAGLLLGNAYQFGKNSSQKNQINDLSRRVDQLQQQIPKPMIVSPTPANTKQEPENQKPPK